MKDLRIGFIGYGFIGRVHAYAYLTLPFFYEHLPIRPHITHICTRRKESAEAGCRQVGAEFAVTDYRAVTENPDIDVVHICSPNDQHRDALISAMAHGKHIYCDKPLTATLQEALDVRDALCTYRGVAQMTLQNRFFPAVMHAKQLLDEGFIGKILEYRACYLHAGSADPDAPMKWKLSAEAGGGVIADLASHVLDLIYHLLGDYASLCAATHIAYPDRPSHSKPDVRVPVDIEDCVMMLTRMRSGAPGCIEATKIATGSEDELRFEIHGSDGALRFNGMHPHFLEVFDRNAAGSPTGGLQGWTNVATGQRYPEPASAFPGPKFSMGWIRTHVACLANFLQSVLDVKPAEPGLDQGIYIQHLMDWTRHSAEEGVWHECAPKQQVISN